MNKMSLKNLTIFDLEIYQSLDLKNLMPLVLETLKDHHYCGFSNSRGLARIINLIQWEAAETTEYFDGEGIYFDQALHAAIHHVMDLQPNANNPFAMLAAECLASASDLFLLGTLSQAGQETDFLIDTMDSFYSYYELYCGEDQDPLKNLLNEVVENPLKTMSDVASYLYTFTSPLLYNEPHIQDLLDLQENDFYPLIHHYNISNWVLNIRNRFPQPQDPILAPSFPQNFDELLKLFQV